VFGCLGLGDCTRACKFDALHIVDDLATVDYEKCTGCTACSKACPRNLRSICKVGCIGCGICAKQSDLFKVEENLARCDYVKYEATEKEETAMNKCPTKVIIYRGKAATEPVTVRNKAETS